MDLRGGNGSVTPFFCEKGINLGKDQREGVIRRLRDIMNKLRYKKSKSWYPTDFFKHSIAFSIRAFFVAGTLFGLYLFKELLSVGELNTNSLIPFPHSFYRFSPDDKSIGILRSAIDVAKGRGRSLSVAWLDLTNAFGSVPHELIEQTLIAYGFPEMVVHVIKDMYKGAAIRVKSKYEKSDRIQIKSGVKQGDPISPTLFNMCLESVIRRHLETAAGHHCLNTNIKVLAFADDMAILSESKIQLQRELKKMNEQCTSLNLIFKPAKCASLIIEGIPAKTAQMEISKTIDTRSGVFCLFQSFHYFISSEFSLNPPSYLLFRQSGSRFFQNFFRHIGHRSCLSEQFLQNIYWNLLLDVVSIACPVNPIPD
uniref:Reverse transcriptase domain-containing protein n=1 Tax=Caenorhabditis tropicalis TaxID=1561998 RepID=A0A1I7U240_9PELO